MSKIYSVVRKNPDRSTTILWTGDRFNKALHAFWDNYIKYGEEAQLVSREMTE